MAIALTGELIDAAAGLTLGFVNEVVAADQLEEAIERWTAMILRGGPHAVRATKALVRHTTDIAVAGDVVSGQEALPAMRAWRASDEPLEGSLAFGDKSRPNWQ
jgi:enoyl-CoA hydratase/carnithine racemase